MAEQEQEPPPLVDTKTVARRLGLTPNGVTRLARQGVLPARRVGKLQWRFDMTEVEAAIRYVPGVNVKKK